MGPMYVLIMAVMMVEVVVKDGELGRNLTTSGKRDSKSQKSRQEMMGSVCPG